MTWLVWKIVSFFISLYSPFNTICHEIPAAEEVSGYIHAVIDDLREFLSVWLRQCDLSHCFGHLKVILILAGGVMA